MSKNNNGSSKNAVLIVLIIAVAIVAIVFIITSNLKNDKNTTSSSNNTISKNATNSAVSSTTTNTSKNVSEKNQTVSSQNSTSNTNNNSNSSNSQSSNQSTNSSTSKLYIGTTSNFQTYDITVDSSLSVVDQAKYLINQISQKLGCNILVNEVYSGKGGMTIDLKSNSAPLTEKNSTLVYSVFDSIKQTLQKYFGTTMDVYFSVEDKDISINTISPAFTINSTAPYKGSGK